MSNIKKLMMSAAGGEALNVEDVFSTYVYTGDDSARSITNGINLAGEGGLVWSKSRSDNSSSTSFHHLIDTERGANKSLNTSDTSGEGTSNRITSFNADGYSLSTDQYINGSSRTFVSWTFRKAPKFFDTVTYTGNGTAGRTISHNLGTTPGAIIIKKRNGNGDWPMYHRGLTSANYVLDLNNTNAEANQSYNYGAAPTSSVFTVGDGSQTNGNGDEFVAYLFAHNDGDGEFGPNGDADIIKCGSYTGNGSSQHIDLGFEPQWILHRRSNDTAPCRIYDVMRGMPVGIDDAILETNSSSAEFTYNEAFQPTATGFTVPYSAPYYNASGNTYIYMAIRRGTKLPESATEVFDVQSNLDLRNKVTTNFVADALLMGETGYNAYKYVLGSRLTARAGNTTSSTAAEVNSWIATDGWEFNDGYKTGTFINSAVSWAWKRAPGYFDVVAFFATIDSNRRLDHNLGVAPEMVWVKRRDNGVRNWYVYHKDLGDASYGRRDYRLYLNTSSAKLGPGINMWGTSDPTATDFGLNENDVIGINGAKCIAYLFATLDGISKVGSYTGNGSSQTIDCGFSSGARFVLIKRVDGTGNWMVMDTARGIVTGDESVLFLDSTIAEQTGDWVDPASSGFIVNDVGTGFNENGSTYIFYAIA